jgi:hypothetical protein
MGCRKNHERSIFAAMSVSKELSARSHSRNYLKLIHKGLNRMKHYSDERLARLPQSAEFESWL